MEQRSRREFLIKYLLDENPGYMNSSIPKGEQEQKALLRGLFNVRMPMAAGEDFLTVQDEYLREEISERGITDIKDLKQVQKDIYLWQGDITALKCGAIVNAANCKLLGCFIPNHRCIDNAIHSFAGVQLRCRCAEIMEKQGVDEGTGSAKITPAFNLPCDYVIHTVGPIVYGALTEEDERLLASCYESCLALADENGVKSIAFCCISTGEFHFPNQRAAEIAVQTVKQYKADKNSDIEVVFNVFKDSDYEIYRKLLG